jgi:hypothetical protein
MRLIMYFGVVALLVASFPVSDTIGDYVDKVVNDKVSVSNESAEDRLRLFTDHWTFFLKLPILSQLLGIGFGYVRSTDFLSTMLVNVGVLGAVLFVCFLLSPLTWLRRTQRQFALAACLIVLTSVLVLSVPEFSYGPLWLFAGMAYGERKRAGISRGEKVAAAR